MSGRDPRRPDLRLCDDDLEESRRNVSVVRAGAIVSFQDLSQLGFKRIGPATRWDTTYPRLTRKFDCQRPSPKTTPSTAIRVKPDGDKLK